MSRTRMAPAATSGMSPEVVSSMADDVLSLRFDADRRGTLTVVAERHGVTVSDLLRAATDHLARLTADEVDALLACPTCKGTGQRFKTTRQPEETP